jgi:hypothetical protein
MLLKVLCVVLLYRETVTVDDELLALREASPSIRKHPRHGRVGVHRRHMQHHDVIQCLS